MSLTLSHGAKDHIRQWQENQGSGYFLRIKVKSGGCSGLSYHFSMEDTPQPSDCMFEDGMVVTDSLSLHFIQGSTVDYHEEMMVAQFVLKNPKAKSSCGCGESFSVF